MFNALGIHGRSTPTIYLPSSYPEPASSLHPQEPFIRNVQSPNLHGKQHIFYNNYYGGISSLSLEFWKMVTEKTFAKSEKDERLLTEARTVRLHITCEISTRNYSTFHTKSSLHTR